MTVERPSATSIIDAFKTDYLKYSGVNVTFSGTNLEYLEQEWLWSVICEMVGNCTENKIPGQRDVGAKEVSVAFSGKEIRIEDNFIYENPETILSLINTFKDSGKPNTSKPIDEELGFSLGGLGIYTSLKLLREHQGGLDYYIRDGAIGVRVYWKNE